MATTTVKGAGRRRAAALSERHAANNATSKLPKNRAKDEIAAPMASASQSATPSKPRRFADDAEAAGWTVEKIRDPKTKRKTVLARRGTEALELSWASNDQFVYPGRYEAAKHARNVRNASEGRKILSQTAIENAPMSTRRPVGVAQAAVRQLTQKVPFDPLTADDATVLAKIRGRKLVWRNSMSNAYEEGRVPAELREIKTKEGFKTVSDTSTFITNSKAEDTLGRRILSFCDESGEGYRALFLDALVQVR
jgi:hypothetical protein